MDTRFLDFNYLYLILLLPSLYFLFKFQKKLAYQSVTRVFNSKRLELLLKNYDAVKEKRAIYFFLAGIFFLLISLARPQTPDGVVTIKNEGTEVILMVDVSRSMMAQDIRPSRLEIAKKELSRLIDMSPGDRFGLIAFAGSAVLLSPVTADREAIKMYLDSLTTDTVSTQGTDLSKALSVAQKAIEDGSLSEADSIDTLVSQSIIIASDGETHEEGAIDKAKELLGKKIKIFTIAFGTTQGAPIPIYDRSGQMRGYLTDKQGQTVMSQVKGDALKEIAETADANFYQFSFGADIMKRLSETLNALEKSRFDESEMRTYGELYFIFTLVSLFCFVWALFMGRSKKNYGKWRGRFEKTT